jgi:hypothetical protein
MARNQNSDQLAHARRLSALGCPLDLDFFQAAQNGLRIKQVGGVIESQIFEIESYGIGCMLNLEIVNCASRPIYLRDFEIELPWIDRPFCLLSDPRDRDETSQSYRFHGTKIEFPRNVVLNWLVPSSTRFAKGRLVAGLVLGQDPEPIPDRYKHGQSVQAMFSIVDQFRDRHSKSVILYIDRSAQFRPKRVKEPHRRLFEVSHPGDEEKLVNMNGNQVNEELSSALSKD